MWSSWEGTVRYESLVSSLHTSDFGRCSEPVGLKNFKGRRNEGWRHSSPRVRRWEIDGGIIRGCGWVAASSPVAGRSEMDPASRQHVKFQRDGIDRRAPVLHHRLRLHRFDLHAVVLGADRQRHFQRQSAVEEKDRQVVHTFQGIERLTRRRASPAGRGGRSDLYDLESRRARDIS